MITEKPGNRTMCFQTAAGTLPVSVTFNKYDAVTSVGWMNWLELNCRRDLVFVGDQVSFRDLATVGVGHITEFTVQQGQNIHQVWEITIPPRSGTSPLTVSGSVVPSGWPRTASRSFVAFRNSSKESPVRRQGDEPGPARHPAAHGPGGRGASHLPAGGPAAGGPEDVRGLSALVVTPQRIYNEFSSGQRDATAIEAVHEDAL